MKRPWKTTEIAQLRKLHGAGMTRAQIAVEMGRTERAVTSRMYQEGIRRPHQPQEAVCILRDRPMTCHQLAQELGSTLASMRKLTGRLSARGLVRMAGVVGRSKVWEAE